MASMAVSPPAASDSPTSPSDTSRQPNPVLRKYAPPMLAFPIIGLCLVVIGGVLYWIVYPQIRAEYHWRQAQKAIFNYDLARGQEHLERCLEVRPTDGEVLFVMARTMRREGKLEEARDYLRRASQQRWVPDQIKLEVLLIKAQTGY